MYVSTYVLSAGKGINGNIFTIRPFDGCSWFISSSRERRRERERERERNQVGFLLNHLSFAWCCWWNLIGWFYFHLWEELTMRLMRRHCPGRWGESARTVSTWLCVAVNPLFWNKRVNDGPGLWGVTLSLNDWPVWDIPAGKMNPVN